MKIKLLRVHHDLKLNLISFRKIMDNEEWLYRCCLRWPMARKKFKYEIDYIESQLTELSKSFNTYKDANGAIRSKVWDLHSQLSL